MRGFVIYHFTVTLYYATMIKLHRELCKNSLLFTHVLIRQGAGRGAATEAYVETV